MTESLRALLANVIDYAELFPPAKLPLDQAAENYVRYRQSQRGWMVGGFVAPAGQLDNLANQSAISKLNELPLCLVATAAETAEAARDSLRDDFEHVHEFVDKVSTAYGTQVRVSVEWRLPPDLAQAESGIPAAVDCLPADTPVLLEAVYCEVPLDSAENHASSLASFQWRTNVQLGLKFRTGGLDAAAFPNSQSLAPAFAACLKSGAPWKCTAGLHHPLPRMDSGVNALMHGFVNVLAASTLGQVHKLDGATLQAILETKSAEHFRFDDSGMTCQVGDQELTASVAQIAAARKSAMSSFGSCSCEEPWEDLQALGWLG